MEPLLAEIKKVCRAKLTVFKLRSFVYNGLHVKRYAVPDFKRIKRIS